MPENNKENREKLARAEIAMWSHEELEEFAVGYLEQSLEADEDDFQDQWRMTFGKA